MRKFLLLILLLFNIESFSSYLLIPMDDSQTNHLKSYGIAFLSIQNEVKVDWLLNYKGGSFLIKHYPEIEKECIVRGVSYQIIADAQSTEILRSISSPSVNQDVVRLEKTPKIAIYSPNNKQPWDDAVTLALAYAEVDYETLWDEEVLNNKLGESLILENEKLHKYFTSELNEQVLPFENTKLFKSITPSENFDIRAYWESQRFNQLTICSMENESSVLFILESWMESNPPLKGVN